MLAAILAIGMMLSTTLSLTSAAPASAGLVSTAFPSWASTPAVPVETLSAAPVEILPQMELLAGVLSQTTWIANRGPEGKGSLYFQALKKFMEPYKDHEAVKIAQSLTDKGFSYDAPPCFACHLGPLPDLEPIGEYSDYVAGRAGGKETLENFRIALKDLAAESHFQEFLDEWADALQGCIQASSAEFDRPKIEKWLTEFFGWDAAEFHVVLAPAMFPGGGYGATVVDWEGRKIGYEIVRSSGKSETAPDLPAGKSIESLTLHELGHYFVNPTLEANASVVQNALRPWFLQVENQMRQMAYPNVSIYANEQILRAACAVAKKDLYGEESYEQAISYEENNGFYLTRPAAEALQGYANNRGTYPTFTEFVPELMSRISKLEPPVSGIDDILHTVRLWMSSAWGAVFLRWGVIIVLGALLVWRVNHVRKKASRPKPE